MLVYRGEEKTKFVFVHIQKTGGSSMHQLLLAEVPEVTPHVPRHMFADQASKRVDDWERYFTFAFVRNPWSRLVSWYSMIDKVRKDREAGIRLTRVQRRRAKRNPLWRQVLERGPTFEDFIKNCTDEVEIEDGFFYSFAYNQLDYLTDKGGDVMVDFVGRFERFAEDLGVVFDELGLDVNAIPHKNPSSHAHYSTLYTPETEQIVRERFHEDIEHFGYEFEDVKSRD